MLFFGKRVRRWGRGVLLELEQGDHASGKAGERIEGAEVGVEVSLQLLLMNLGAEIAELLANLEHGKEEAGTGKLGGVSIGGEALEGIHAGVEFVAPGLVFEPKLVAGSEPVREVGDGNAGGFGPELFGDTGVRDAIIHELVEAFAKMPGQAVDLATAAFGGSGIRAIRRLRLV